MQDKKPDWNIWLRMPTVSVSDAIELTLNRDPRATHWNWLKPPEFKDRVMLCRAVHGSKVAPALLSEWAQSVGWNIPKALAALAPRPEIQYPPADADLVIAALADIAMPGEGLALYAALLAFGVRFSGRADALEMNTPDDTVNGRTEPVSGSAVKSLCGQAGGEALSYLIRGSGFSGGGAQSSTSWAGLKPLPAVIEPTSAPKYAESLASVSPAVTHRKIADESPPPLTSKQIAFAFDGIYDHDKNQWSKKLSDVKNAAWLLPARVACGNAPKPSTWNPVRLAELLQDKGVTAEVLNRLFFSTPTLKPWLTSWQESTRALNGFGR